MNHFLSPQQIGVLAQAGAQFAVLQKLMRKGYTLKCGFVALTTEFFIETRSKDGVHSYTGTGDVLMNAITFVLKQMRADGEVTDDM